MVGSAGRTNSHKSALSAPGMPNSPSRKWLPLALRVQQARAADRTFPRASEKARTGGY